MTFTSVLLVVAAAIIHASWNLLAKSAASVGPVFVCAYNFVSVLIYLPWVAVLVWQGRVQLSAMVVAFVLLSGLIHLAYSLVLQKGYQRADLSVVYPVARGTGPLLSSLGAVLILGEVPSGSGVIGLLLVAGGIILIASDGRLTLFARPEGREGLFWGGATGGLIASYAVVDSYAVKTLGIVPVFLDWVSNLMRFLLLLPLVLRDPRRARQVMRGHWRTALAVGLLSPLSYILILAALTDGAPLSVVAPMREMSMMVAALMALVILREPVGRWRLGGCAVLMTGVNLLATA